MMIRIRHLHRRSQLRLFVLNLTMIAQICYPQRQNLLNLRYTCSMALQVRPVTIVYVMAHPIIW